MLDFDHVCWSLAFWSYPYRSQQLGCLLKNTSFFSNSSAKHRAEVCSIKQDLGLFSKSKVFSLLISTHRYGNLYSRPNLRDGISTPRESLQQY